MVRRHCSLASTPVRRGGSRESGRRPRSYITPMRSAAEGGRSSENCGVAGPGIAGGLAALCRLTSFKPRGSENRQGLGRAAKAVEVCGGCPAAA